MKKQRTTKSNYRHVALPEELYQILFAMADKAHRSVRGQVCFLLDYYTSKEAEYRLTHKITEPSH